MSKFKLGILLGCGIGLVASGAAAIWLLRDPIPPLTKAAFDEAVRRWQSRKVDDYDLTVVYSGGQTGTYEVEVRAGNVARMTRDGAPLAERRANWRYWTVPGMFELVEMDFARLETASLDGNAGGNVKVSVEFDEAWGFPRRYRQIQLRGRRTTSEWLVTRFAPRTSGE
jgi:hypothetical protein